jgi:hypothetical protein
MYLTQHCYLNAFNSTQKRVARLKEKRSRANALYEKELEISITCEQAQVTTGSQWLALPLNASLLVELPSSSLQGHASFQ